MLSSGGTPWQPPSCGATSIMTTLVLTAINTSLLEQRSAPESCVRDEYDFVVVGGGSAGCVLASRLSENPDWSVLLLEAGGEQPEVSKAPGFYWEVGASPLNWMWTSETQNNSVCENGCEVSKGKGLGGGSVINGMLYVRGNHDDFRYWNEPSWTYEKALPFFKKSENNRDHDIASDTTYHSTGGPLSVQRQSFQDENIAIFYEAMEELGFTEVDFNGKNQLGHGLFQTTVSGSERASSNTAFLDPIRDARRNLHIQTQAFVTKVLFQPGTKRVNGVTYLDSLGVLRTVMARMEVVLCTGTVGNPQLLMLSGVGPADHLKEMDIPLVVDLPGVGENLQDHPRVQTVSFQLNGTATEPADLERRVADLVGYLRLRDGPLSSNGLFQYGSFRRSAAQPRDDPRPYLQYVLSGVSQQQDDEQQGSASCTPGSRTLNYFTEVSMFAFLLHPRSRGRVWLGSPDPLLPPRIQLNLLQDDKDLRVLVEGLRWIAKLGRSKALRSRGIRMVAPNGPAAPAECQLYDVKDDRLWECLVRASLASGIHYVGTCAIGGVLDERLTVRGVVGLRVADASAIPLAPSGNTNAPTIMVAERAACIIRKHHEHGYTPAPGEQC